MIMNLLLLLAGFSAVFIGIVGFRALRKSKEMFKGPRCSAKVRDLHWHGVYRAHGIIDDGCNSKAQSRESASYVQQFL